MRLFSVLEFTGSHSAGGELRLRPFSKALAYLGKSGRFAEAMPLLAEKLDALLKLCKRMCVPERTEVVKFVVQPSDLKLSSLALGDNDPLDLAFDDENAWTVEFTESVGTLVREHTRNSLKDAEQYIGDELWKKLCAFVAVSEGTALAPNMRFTGVSDTTLVAVCAVMSSG